MPTASIVLRGLPRGMSFSPAADGTKAALNWKPDYFSTQEAPLGGHDASVWQSSENLFGFS